MRIHIIAAAVGIFSLWSVAALADGTMPIPSQYLVGSSPKGVTPQQLAATHSAATVAKAQSAVEKPADAFDGSFYAEVFPVFAQGDSSGNISYLRLGNNNAAPTTFHIIVLGAPSGADYGEADFVIPAYGSPQISFAPDGSSTDVVTKTGAGPLANGDTLFSLYIYNPDDNTFFQNVIFNGGNQFFEDFTICLPGAGLEGNKILTNVHTSLLAAFPSTVYIHNLLNVNAEYTVTVRDARTGLTVGTIPSLIANANATYAIPFSFFQQQINFTPHSGQEHANLEFDASAAFAKVLDPNDPNPNPANISDVGGIFGSAVYNQTLAAYINLSNKCSINR